MPGGRKSTASSRTYERLSEELPRVGAQLAVLSPADFRTLPCPTYPQIELAIPNRAQCEARIAMIAPDAIHIATEGPVGWMARAYCRRRGLPFTTSFHTKFPEYLRGRFGVPDWASYALLRRFHGARLRHDGGDAQSAAGAAGARGSAM